MHSVAPLWLWAVSVLLSGQATGTERPSTSTRPFVVRGIMHTNGSASSSYRLPTWESSLTVFGVEAESDVHINLIHPVDKRCINISLAVQAYAKESQIAAHQLGHLVSVVTRESVDLSLDEFTWFSIFRTRDLVALYNEGATQPFLLYFNNHTINETDFLEFNMFQVYSRRNASWDFNADRLGTTNSTPVVPKGMQHELEGVVEGVGPRLSLLETFYKTHTLGNLTKSNLKVLVSELYWVKAYLKLLTHYGYNVSGRNMTEAVVGANSMINEIEVILDPGQKVMNETSAKTTPYGKNATQTGAIINPGKEVTNGTDGKNVTSAGTIINPVTEGRNRTETKNGTSPITAEAVNPNGTPSSVLPLQDKEKQRNETEKAYLTI